MFQILIYFLTIKCIIINIVAVCCHYEINVLAFIIIFFKASIDRPVGGSAWDITGSGLIQGGATDPDLLGDSDL